MQTYYDIAVIGGGPAGAVTALCLARSGWRVGIFERTAFDQFRFGETLPPEINPLLRKLDVFETFLRQTPLESPGIVSMWGASVPVEVDFARNAWGCGWHINRNHFDLALCHDAVAAGANLFLNSRLNWTSDRTEWCAKDIRAGFLIHAGGRHGPIRQLLTPQEHKDSLLAVVFQIDSKTSRQGDQRTWIESAPAGWWYSAPLPEGAAVTMFFTGAEIYRAYGVSIKEQLEWAPHARSLLRGASFPEPKVAYAPSCRSRTIFGRNWLLVGDSASSYDPLSGRGVFKALQHARSAARAVDLTLRGDRDAMQAYAMEVEREFDSYRQQRRQFYLNERRWPNHPFWEVRQAEFAF